MARLAEIREAATKEAGQPTRTVYINPFNVISVAPLPNGARIVLRDEQVIQTTVSVAEVVGSINEALIWKSGQTA